MYETGDGESDGDGDSCMRGLLTSNMLHVCRGGLILPIILTRVNVLST